MRRPTQSRSGAFTLLELMMALLLISFVAGICVPAYFNRASVTLENAAQLLAQDMRSAQNRAAYLGEPIEVIFDPVRHGYRVWRTGGARGDDAGSYVRLYTKDAVFEGVELVSVDFGGDTTLTFDRSGHPTEPGSVTLAYGTEVRTLHLEAPSGRLYLPDSSAGWYDRGFVR